MNEALIARVPLFANLPETEIRFLGENLRQRRLAQGTFLMVEGDYGDLFYIVLEGQVEIVKAMGTPDQRRLNMHGPGEYVGEMSLLNRTGLRTASARAVTSIKVLEMTRADFDALLHRQPTLAYEMVRVLSLRLQESDNTTIRELKEKNQQLTLAFDELKSAQAQIIEKEKLEHELQVARQVQASLLPHHIPELPGWEFAARWRPAREVAGDYYDFIPFDDRRLGLIVGDVTDKGMPAALFMALTRSTVRASLIGAASPAEGISAANLLISADSLNSMFVTLFYGQLDPAAGELTYVNAGHPPPLHYRAATDEFVELTRTGIALGLFGASQFQQGRAKLESGDCLLLYTDGLTDADNREGRRFGKDALQPLLRRAARSDAVSVVVALETALDDFTGGATPFDDVTLMVVRHL